MARKKKAKAKITIEPNLAKCGDCDWEGLVSKLIWSERMQRCECPNCTGTNFSVDGKKRPSPWHPEETKNIPKSAVAVETYDPGDAYCRDCAWEGPAYVLSVNPKTAKDECPECYSGSIDYLDTKKVRPSRGTSNSYFSCYKDHPALPLIDGLVIYGGSCITPAKEDCDIYIGFDRGMSYTTRSMPWNDGEEFLFAITDGSTPKRPANFKKMVEWTSRQLRYGRSVHAGCIGGHGRTGLFFAALVAYMKVSDDPIKYVREHYCKKAVESKEQIKFLIDNYGVKTAKGSKVGRQDNRSVGEPLMKTGSTLSKWDTAWGGHKNRII